MIDIVNEFSLMWLVKDVYPVSFISLILFLSGYLKAAIPLKRNLKSIDEDIKRLEDILEKCH